jgi:hypothetical protein
VLRHEDDTANAGNLRRVGQALAVIAGREGDDAPVPLFRGQLHDRVQRPAGFEGPRAL